MVSTRHVSGIDNADDGVKALAAYLCAILTDVSTNDNEGFS